MPFWWKDVIAIIILLWVLLRTGLTRASDISRKKKQNFAGFSGANSPKNRPISREKSQNLRKNRPVSRDFRGKKSNFEGFSGPNSPGGVLPYITYTGMCRPKGSWFWSCWFRKGYPFQRRFLERGIKFRTHESSTFVSSHVKVFKDRLLFKIRFNALISKLLYSCCTLEQSIKN